MDNSFEKTAETAFPWPTLYNRLLSADRETVRRIIARLMAGDGRGAVIDALLPSLLTEFAETADPVRGLVCFERFINRFDDPLPVLQLLANNPRAVEILGKVFSGSQFLTETLIRTPQAFEQLIAYRRTARPKSSEQLFNEILIDLAHQGPIEDQLNALRCFQSREMLRIGACDLLDLYDLPAVIRQLSNLADALIRVCLKLAAAQVGATPEQLTVLGMGKLGGRELNYSSDIDLLFITSAHPAEAERVGKQLIDNLAHITSDGFLYRVDMRLRPWGQVGPLVTTVPGYLNYLQKNARWWEKQALLKVRVIAGDLEAGRSLLEQVRPLLLGGSYDDLQASVREMKQRTEEQLRQKGREWGEVKLGQGSIRDVEFTTQFLQLAYGETHPEVLSPNTLDGLVRLATAALISPDDYRTLAEGYVFQRTIEHFLQIMDYRQTHSLPEDPAAQAALARRLGFRGEDPGKNFVERYTQHVAAIRDVYLHYVGGSSMKPVGSTDPEFSPTGANQAQIHHHLDRMAPSYAEVYSADEIARHAALAALLNSDNPVEVEASRSEDGSWHVTVVAYDFAGEFSAITGLLFVYGLNILTGEAFTYEPLKDSTTLQAARDTRRKIVDVFNVYPSEGIQVDANTWTRYAQDLAHYHHVSRSDMQGDLIRRVAHGLQGHETTAEKEAVPALYPIGIEIDNSASPQSTVLRIDAQDTIGFLYELTNALAVSGVYIERVMIDTVGSQVRDVLFVTNQNGQKITLPDKQQELRAATVLIKHFTHLLPFSPNPESALVHFRDFIDQLFHRPNWTNELTSVQQPEVLQALARVLGVSDFLWDDFLRMQYANLFPVVTDMDSLETAKSRQRLQTELEATLSRVHAGPQVPSQDAAWIEKLTAWRDREMFRIDMRHILGQTQEFWDFAEELTDLAEVITNATFHLCHEDLRLLYGSPLKEDGSPSQMCVLALGKFGGHELGFASDIELMFVYDGNGSTSGPKVISTAEFYEKVVEAYVPATRARREGIFQVDLQLRPYGKIGSLAVSLESFRRYYSQGGPAWAYERQALVRLRPVAGDRHLGAEVAQLRDKYVYTGEPFDVTSMRAMRERQLRHLVQAGSFNLKYSLGGLVDIEYLVQGLQIANGHRLPALRQTNTRASLAALADAGLLSPETYTHLRKAHTFLRWLIDSLRVVRGNARDVTLPAEDSEEFAFLARRMRYGDDTARLYQELLSYTAYVREANRVLLPRG